VKVTLSRKQLIASAILVGAVIVAVPIVHEVRQRQYRLNAASCANHAIQLKFLVMSYAEKQERFPPDQDTRAALMKMADPEQWPSRWFSSYGSSCPEAFRRDKSIGYVFVADGLITKTKGDPALVLFCPADSHRRSDQHSHAVLADGTLSCLRSNAEMIQSLRRELGRAKEGSILYSAKAQASMQRELTAREKHGF